MVLVEAAVFGADQRIDHMRRNVGQLEWTGTLAAPLAFEEPPTEPIELDQRQVPWELREDPPDRN